MILFFRFSNLSDALLSNFRRINCFTISSKPTIILYLYLKLFFEICIIPFDQMVITPTTNFIKLIRSYFYLNGLKNQDNFNTATSLCIFVLILNTFNILTFMTYQIQKYKFIQSLKKTLIIINLIFSKCFIGVNVCLANELIIKQQYVMFAIPFLNLFLIIGFTLACQIFLFSYSFKKIYGLTRNHSWVFSIRFLLLTSLFIFGFFVDLFQKIQFLTLNLVFLILNIYQLYHFMNNKIYYNNFTQKVYLSVILMSISLSMLTFVQYIFPLFGDNFLLCIFSFWGFSFIGFRNLRQYLKEQVLLLNVSQIKEERLALQYLRQFHNLIRESNNQSSMMLVVIIMQHITNCQKQTCKCKSINYQLCLDKQFLINYLDSMMQQIKQNVDSESLRLMIIYYKVQVVESYTTFFTQLKQLSSNNLLLKQGLQSIRCTIKEQIEKQNKLNNSLQIERVLKSENTILQVNQLLQTQIRQLKNKWGQMKKDICQLNKIQKNLIQSNIIILKMHTIWERLQSQQSVNLQICTLFMFYFKNIVFIDFQLRKVKKFMDTLKIKYLQQQKMDVSQFQKFIFSKNNCVLESPLDPNKMGQITNITKNCINIFGVKKLQIVGKLIGNLMPSSMADEHNKMLARWVQTGRYQSFNKLIDTFCISAQQVCFQCYLYIRLIYTPNGFKFIVSILKRNESNYLLLNNKLQIQGYGAFYNDIIGNERKGSHIKDIWPQLGALLKNSKTDHQKATLHHLIQINNSQSDYHTHCQEQVVLNISNKSLKISIQYYSIYVGKILIYVVKIDNYHLKSNQQKSQLEKLQQINQNQHLISISSNKLANNQYQCLLQQEKLCQRSDDDSSIDSITHFSDKMFEKTLKHIYNPAKMKTQKKFFFIVALIIIIIFMSSCLYIETQIYSAGLLSISNVLLVEGEVSHTIQILQILYNKIIIIHELSNSTKDLQKRLQVAQSAKYIANELYNIVYLHQYYLIKNNSSSGFPLYKYLLHPVKLKIKNSQKQLQTFQFIGRCYYLVIQIIQQIKKNQTINYQLIDKLKDNWDNIKLISHYNIQFYKNQSNVELQTLKLNIILISMLQLLFTVTLLVIVCYYIKQNQQIKQKILKTNQYISIDDVQNYYHYYSNLKVNDIQIKQHKSKTIEIKDYKKISKTKFKYQFKTKKYLLLIILVFIFKITFQKSTLIQMTSLFRLTDQVIHQINELLKSQTYLFESYIQIKSKYLLNYPSNQNNYQFYKSYVNRSNDKFSIYAIKISNIFQRYNPNYYFQFTKLLQSDICFLIQQFYPNDQINKCRNNTSFHLITKGIISSIRFFHRLTNLAYIDLQNNQKNPSLFFKQLQYQDIDDFSFFMLRIYQIIHNNSINGLNHTFDVELKYCYNIIYVLYLFKCLLIIILIVSYRFLKIQLSKIYGYGLYYPPSIIRQNKLITKVLQEIQSQVGA